MILVIDGGTTPTKLACSRRSDSGEYFLSLSLLRTALHYLNAWNRLQPNERDLRPTETLTYFYNKLRNYSANFLTKNRWFSKNWQTWYFNWHPFATETAKNCTFCAVRIHAITRRTPYPDIQLVLRVYQTVKWTSTDVGKTETRSNTIISR